MNKMCKVFSFLAASAVLTANISMAAELPYNESFDNQKGPVPIDNKGAAWLQAGSGSWSITKGAYRTVVASTGEGVSSAASLNVGNELAKRSFRMSADMTLNSAVMPAGASSARVGFAAFGSGKNLVSSPYYIVDYVISTPQGRDKALGTVRIGEFGGDEPIITSTGKLTPAIGTTYRMTLVGRPSGKDGITLSFTVTDLATHESVSVVGTYATALSAGGLFGFRNSLANVEGAAFDVSFDNFSLVSESSASK
jgi:hypothetical protein